MIYLADKRVRYGAEIRKRVEKIEKTKRELFICPTCQKKKVKRIGNSLWKCKSCGSVFAGGAYSLTTSTGEIASRLVQEYNK